MIRPVHLWIVLRLCQLCIYHFSFSIRFRLLVYIDIYFLFLRSISVLDWTYWGILCLYGLSESAWTLAWWRRRDWRDNKSNNKQIFVYYWMPIEVLSPLVLMTEIITDFAAIDWWLFLLAIDWFPYRNLDMLEFLFNDMLSRSLYLIMYMSLFISQAVWYNPKVIEVWANWELVASVASPKLYQVQAMWSTGISRDI